VFRNGRYAIIDRGSNPISVNGRPLGNGQETFIQPGDELQIGGYAMRVETAGPAGGAAAAGTFADFPGLGSTPPAGARAAAPAAPFADPLAASRPTGVASGGGHRPMPAGVASGAGRGGIPRTGIHCTRSEDERAARPGLRPLARSALGGGGGNFGLESAAAPRP
jgi:FHA domain-containing protein